MKRFYIITILAVICGIIAIAQNRPVIAHTTNGGDRIKFNGLTLDYDNETIIVNGTSDYYEVTITSLPSQEVVHEEVIDGINGIIIVSSWSSGTYTIELTSSIGSVYQWTFYHSLGQSVNNIGKKGELINHISDLNTLSF